jgi:hypothetical protein
MSMHDICGLQLPLIDTVIYSCLALHLQSNGLAYATVGGDSPVGTVDSLVHRSSLRATTPERDEPSRQVEEDFLHTRDRHLR